MLTAAPDGRAVFSAPGDDAGAELWETDGTPEGTRRLSDINPGPGASDPESAYLTGRTLLFSAFDPARNRELWAYRFPGGPCPADWDLSGAVNSQDFFEFLSDYFNGAADFNDDLTTDSSDVFDFLASFFEGC
jgi:ELWxxDGT repeat protein